MYKFTKRHKFTDIFSNSENEPPFMKSLISNNVTIQLKWSIEIFSAL